MSRSPSYEEFRSRRYFSSLDIFRCWSILGVIWYHTGPGVAWFPASGRGFLGVDFFFVISGFLVVTLLLRERQREGAISLRQFYMRRALRIFPIYYAMLAAVTAYYLLRKPHDPQTGVFVKELPYQVFYLSNFSKNMTFIYFTWTLSTEEQFYVLWPPIEKWLARAAVPVLLGFIALNQCVNFRLITGVPPRQISEITYTPICLGVLLAHLLNDGRTFAWLWSWLGQRWVPLVLLGGLVLACNYPGTDLMGWPRLLIQLLMTLLLASCVVREDHWLNDVFGWPAARRIGVVSYGMYLYHVFVIYVLDAMLEKAKLVQFVMFLLSVILTMLVAELSFRFYETPFLRLKERLGQRAWRREPQEPAELVTS
jgi:peptidoglycan/LPS O-acetylase OafA/YrhL